jgi:hypothetical protein
MPLACPKRTRARVVQLSVQLNVQARHRIWKVKGEMEDSNFKRPKEAMEASMKGKIDSFRETLRQ